MADNRRYNKNINSALLEYHFLVNPTDVQRENAYTDYTYVPLVDDLRETGARLYSVIKIDRVPHYRLINEGEPRSQTWVDGVNSFETLYDRRVEGAIAVFATPDENSPVYLREGDTDSGYKYYQKVSSVDYFELCGKMPSSLKNGEVAVNRKNGYETLFVQNDAGEMVEFRNYEACVSYTDMKVGEITDEKVKQTSSSANYEYPVLTKSTIGTTTVTEGSKFSSSVTINPQRGRVTATSFSGDGSSLSNVDAATVTGYTVGTDVPSDAVFTDTVTIQEYDAPDYPEGHISQDYTTIIVNNEIEVGDTYDYAINALDNKLAGLSQEVANDEAVWTQTLEDETRYFATCHTVGTTNAKTARLVDNRNYTLLNGTRLEVYFSTAHTSSGVLTLNVNNTGAKTLVYNDGSFDGTLIEAGTTLSVVYDASYNSNAGCYRVVGGVGGGKFINGLASGTTENHIVVWGSDGYHVEDSGFTIATSVPANAVFTDTTYSADEQLHVTGTTMKHDEVLGSSFRSLVESVTISGDGGTFKVPALSFNQYGHVVTASDATITISNTIANYNAPVYDEIHVSADWLDTIQNNEIDDGDTFSTGINYLDNKIKGLADELILDETVLSQAIEDEPRYYAKSNTVASTATKIATLVEHRQYNLLNGTKVTVYFSTANTADDPILVNVNSTGAKILIYNDAVFDGSLIEAGTTLEMVYDDNVNFIVGESPNTTTYTECYRVVGGVGSGSSSPCSGATTAVINVNNPIGDYAVGDTIVIGTCLEEIIRKMLCVVIDVIAYNPALSWSWSPSTTVEVGTTVTPVQSASVSDGYFTSSDTVRYTNAQFDTNNNTTGGRLAAGCPMSGDGYGVTYPTAVTNTTDTDNTFTATLYYGASTNVPKKSDNTDSSVLISAGSTSSDKNVYWRYRAFYGFTAYISGTNFNTKYNGVTFNNIMKVDGTQGCEPVWCNTGTTDTTIASMIASNSSYTTLVLLLPVAHHVITWTETPAQPGTDVHDNWDQQYSSGTTPATLTRVVNGTSITYYIYTVDNKATGLEQRNIKFH